MALYKRRKIWIDTAKGIGIILVVYGHVTIGLTNAGLPVDQALFSLINQAIYSFHMPLFFVLSGLLFPPFMERNEVPGMFWSKVRTIAYPYVLWSLLQGVIEVSLARFTNGDASISTVLKLGWQPRAQFWFLYALFFVSCTSLLLYSRRAMYSHRMIFFGAILLYLMHGFVSTYPPLNYVASNLVYFVLGVSLQSVADEVVLNKRHLTFVAALLFIVAQCVVYVGTQAFPVVAGYAVAFLVAVVSIFSVIVFSVNLDIQKRTWISYLGECSLTIYLMHTIASSGVRIVLQKLFHVTDPWIHLLLGLASGILLPVVAQSVMNRKGLNYLIRFPIQKVGQT